MIIETTGEPDLANDGGSDEAILGQLAEIRERSQRELETALQGGAEEGAEAEEEQEDEEEVAGEAPDEVVEDDDPEIDLGEIKLKKSELKAGYMKDADYRRKTSEAAEVKRAAQEETQRARAEREYLANQVAPTLNLLHQQLVGEAQDLAQLAKTDPAEWVRANAIHQERVAVFQRALNDHQELANRARAEQEAEMATWRKAERDKLHDKLPEWRDPGKAQAEQKLVAEYLLEQGYSQDDLKELFDHRALIVAREAALWRQHQAAVKSVKDKQVKTEPGKPLKPGAAQSKEPQAKQAYQEALNRARKSGDEGSIMALLAAKRAK